MCICVLCFCYGMAGVGLCRMPPTLVTSFGSDRVKCSSSECGESTFTARVSFVSFRKRTSFMRLQYVLPPSRDLWAEMHHVDMNSLQRTRIT
ncbi:hypothetical protein EDB86DRAFT_158144 [Lactarius hatsudake]|nr:hypothetical protein EDB86DRAFT_158144 [Lactarius hatsudake]